MENQVCKNCSNAFVIDVNDFAFYQKINVPKPTFCPDCRCMRRMVHRNERSLHKRTCDKTGKNIISIYRPDCPYTVWDKDIYFSDEFVPESYAKDYNLNQEFFPQFYELAKAVPLPSLFLRNSENATYNQDMSNSKNCYLCFRTHDSQNMLYTYRGNKSSDCTDCFQAVEQSEFLYECVNVAGCSNSQFLHSCEKCSDSAFLYNCVACIDCFMCTDLRSKQNCFMNVQYSREEYKQILDSYELHTIAGQARALAEFEQFLKIHPQKNLNIIRSNNVSGDSIFDSKDSHDVWNVRGLQNCAYVWDSMNFTDSMDTYSGAKVDLGYEITATTKHSSNIHFSIRVHSQSRDCEYSWFLQNCSNCFGCAGLTNKEYCILNKQYEKEEYFVLLEQIKKKMTEDGEYGEFFPFYTSPFPYNDTVAHEFFPKHREDVKALGMQWGEISDKNYEPTLEYSNLPNSIDEVDESILKEIISCEDLENCEHGCTGAFRIVADELAFYKRRNIPLPRKCSNCRYYRRLEYRNPSKLRIMTCMCEGNVGLANGIYQNTAVHNHGESLCGLEIQTTFKQEKDFIIYCDGCYKKEIY